VLIGLHPSFGVLLSFLQVLGRQCGASGWPGEQVIVAAAARRYVRAAVKLAARGQFSKRDGERLKGAAHVYVLCGCVWVCVLCSTL
jgi:hypothetical protein